MSVNLKIAPIWLRPKRIYWPHSRHEYDFCFLSDFLWSFPTFKIISELELIEAILRPQQSKGAINVMSNINNFISADSIVCIRDAAISFIYLILFGTSAFEKFRSLTVPEWFFKQFEKTLLGRSKTMLVMSYWKISSLELLLAVLFAGSLLMPALLVPALLLAMFLFGILCFGLRMSYDFQGSANMFTYFGVSLLSLFVVLFHP